VSISQFSLLATFVFFVIGFAAAPTVAAPNSVKQDSVHTQALRDEWLSEDKFQHFFVSAFLTGLGFAVWREGLDRGENQSLAISGGMTLSIGVGKELLDLKRPKGHASLKDFVADVLGIGITIFLIEVL
jgi:uncharacterized protein YfiM (DUF2279 family)